MNSKSKVPQITGVGTSQVLATSRGQGPWAASLQVVASGTVTYNIEVSNNKTDWHVHTSALTGSTMVNIGSLGPVAFIRLRVTAGTGAVTGHLYESC